MLPWPHCPPLLLPPLHSQFTPIAFVDTLAHIVCVSYLASAQGGFDPYWQVTLTS